MNKYSPDLYHVILFDRFGGKVDVMIAGNYIQGKQIGDDIVNECCEVTSYVVARIIFNSLIRKW